MSYEILAVIGGVILCIIAGITFYFQKKQLVKSGNKDKLKGPLPWWYYLGIFFSAILVFGPFDKIFNYLGYAIAIFMMGFGMKHKMK